MWTASDELWYNYRDPAAEGVPGALDRLRALRRDGGWAVPLKGETVFIADGTDRDADVALEQLREVSPAGSCG